VGEPLLELHLQPQVSQEADNPGGFFRAAERKRREIDRYAIAAATEDLGLDRSEATGPTKAFAEKAASQVRPGPREGTDPRSPDGHDFIGAPAAKLAAARLKSRARPATSAITMASRDSSSSFCKQPLGRNAAEEAAAGSCPRDAHVEARCYTPRSTRPLTAQASAWVLDRFDNSRIFCLACFASATLRRPLQRVLVGELGLLPHLEPGETVAELEAGVADDRALAVLVGDLLECQAACLNCPPCNWQSPT